MLDLFLPEVDPDIDQLHQATAIYTHEKTVDHVLDLAGWPMNGGLLIDPGAGNGAFVGRALERLDPPVNDANYVGERLEAWEINPIAAEQARERITRILVRRSWTAGAARKAAYHIIVEEDFLAPGPKPRRAAVVLGNPPYARTDRIPSRLKELYQKTVPPYANADLLHAFLDRAEEALVDGGVLACVTSDRWLINEGPAELREKIGRRFGIDRVQRLGTESAFYVPKTRRKGTPPRVHPVVITLKSHCQAQRPLSAEPVYPDCAENVIIPENAIELGTVANIRIAPWLGAHGVLTLDRNAAAHLPPEYLVPCADLHDADDDDRIDATTRVAIRTTADVAPPEPILQHIRLNQHLNSERARRNPYWLPAESWGDLPYSYESILIPRIAREIRPIRLATGILPINHGVSVISSEINLDQIEAALRSDLAQSWIRKHAARLENDYLSITTRLLRRLPIVLD